MVPFPRVGRVCHGATRKGKREIAGRMTETPTSDPADRVLVDAIAAFLSSIGLPPAEMPLRRARGRAKSRRIRT